MTRKRGTGHAPFCSGGHALDVDCATAYDLAQAKRDKDEAAAQLDAPAAKPMNDCSPKPRHADPVSELRKVHDAMHAGKSYSFEQSLLCDLLRLLESPPPETPAVGDSGMWEREYRIEHSRVERLTGELIEAQRYAREVEDEYRQRTGHGFGEPAPTTKATHAKGCALFTRTLVCDCGFDQTTGEKRAGIGGTDCIYGNPDCHCGLEHMRSMVGGAAKTGGSNG